MRPISLKHDGKGGKPFEVVKKFDLRARDLNEKVLMDRIIVDPQITVGKPIIKGNRITVQLIVQLSAKWGDGS